MPRGIKMRTKDLSEESEKSKHIKSVTTDWMQTHQKKNNTGQKKTTQTEIAKECSECNNQFSVLADKEEHKEEEYERESSGVKPKCSIVQNKSNYNVEEIREDILDKLIKWHMKDKKVEEMKEDLRELQEEQYETNEIEMEVS